MKTLLHPLAYNNQDTTNYNKCFNPDCNNIHNWDISAELVQMALCPSCLKQLNIIHIYSAESYKNLIYDFENIFMKKKRGV